MVAESSTIKRIAGEVIATGVSFEEYLDKYAGDYCELVEGNVIKMSPASLQHNMIWNFIYMLLGAYFELKPIGKVITQPFPQRLENVEPIRKPDLMVILNENSDRLKPTVMDGAADICIEVVSPESVDRDHGEKLSEYEKGGVGEYWIIDYLHKECRFFRRDEHGGYIRHGEDEKGNYRTPALPSLVLHVPTLWQEELPGPIAVGESVKAMLK